MVHLLRAVSACLLLTCTALGHAFVPQDPRLDWRTLETDHFRIHFHGEEALAREVGAIAEAVHRRLTEPLAWRPIGKTEVVLTDTSDFPNGLATPYPYNLMLLWVSPPEAGAFLEAEDRAQWLDTLITHEYAHVLHLDRAHAGPRALRGVFGRHLFTFPNLFQPTWLIEGLATHYEGTHGHGAGRGEAAEFDMLMRTEVRDGVRPLAQVNVPNASWPAGTVPYLYGVYFFQFLEAEYGAERVAAFIHAYSGQLIPFQLNGTARRVFGKDFPALWAEFERHLHARYAPQLAAIRAAGPGEGAALTEGGYAGRGQGGNLQAMADGSVYFVRADGQRRPALMHRSPDGRLTRVTALNDGARIRVHPEAGVLIAQPEVCREYRVYYDLYLLAHGARRPQRLTHCARYRDAAWHPSGDAIAAVRFETGRSELHRLDARGRFQAVLARGVDGELFAQPDYAPDGERLLLSRSARGAGGDLHELTLADGTWRRLTDDGRHVQHPRYSRDGQSVLFTSDHGGVYDLRRLRLSDGALETLTRVETGAFQPSEGADGALYYLGYGSQGYDLYRLEAPTARPTPPPPEAPRAAPPLAAADAPVEAYRPGSALRPRLWFPYLVLDEDVQEVGAFTFGLDPLGIHYYAVQPVVDLSDESLLGSLAYVYSDRWFLSYARYNEVLREGGEFERVRRHHRAALAWRLPRTRLYHAWNLYLGGVHELSEDRRLGEDAPPRADLRDDLVGIALHYRDSNAFRLSISEQDGRRVRLVAEHSVADSDYRGEVYTLDWREYLHLGGTHVLALRALQGWGTDTPRPFALGGVRSDLAVDTLTPTGPAFNRRSYSLRGYADGHPELRGRRMSLASVEYRFPLALVERGIMAPPLGLHRWSGRLFVEGGATWDDARPSRLHPGAGAEAVLDVTAGYRLGLRVRVGYAHGFDREVGGGNQVYAALGGAF
ncbi:hypothetical protein HUS23_09585 [Ectothiorhodospiraceae bacterium 2226]|nr:hypothetical protein HUS23_09585 [Ectothiorhodospiraceae bacterium 2226]